MQTTTMLRHAPAPLWVAYDPAGSARRLGVEGTTPSAARRIRATLAPTSRPTANSSKVIALLPTNDAVVFDGVAGIRSWSPPV